MIRSLVSRFFQRLRADEGTATIEFVLVSPVLAAICVASVEAGFYATKHVMMERGLDLVIRDIRLNLIATVDHDTLRDRICASGAGILGNCTNVLKVELLPVSTSTFVMPSPSATCIDRGQPTQPATTVAAGQSSELTFVRICAVQDPLFPTTGFGLRMQRDAYGGYQLISSSVFVTEPR